MEMRTTRRSRLLGSVYIHVLGASMLVTIIGLAAVTAVRLQTRAVQRASDDVVARACAVSAVELGLLQVEQDPNWRTAWPNGAWLSDKSLGDGTFILEGVDPQDGDLTDSVYEPLILTGIGTKGIARHKMQVVLVPVIGPLEALDTCLHASETVTVGLGHSITVQGAPLSTNAVLNVSGTVNGDAEADTVQGSGTIAGSTTAPADAKEMPGSSVISDYIARATVVPYSGAMDKVVLAAGSNPWGPADPNGLYFIDTDGSDLQIKNTRIHGTLIVRTDGGILFVEDAVLMQNYRSDYPVLIVDGDVCIRHKSAGQQLSESACGTNFNPFGVPYDGQWDSDTSDTYDNEIRGLVHISGDLDLGETARIEGAIICEGQVYVGGTNVIVHDPGLCASPPEGYTYVERMKVSPGSWQQVVD